MCKNKILKLMKLYVSKTLLKLMKLYANKKSVEINKVLWKVSIKKLYNS